MAQCRGAEAYASPSGTRWPDRQAISPAWQLREMLSSQSGFGGGVQNHPQVRHHKRSGSPFIPASHNFTILLPSALSKSSSLNPITMQPCDLESFNSRERFCSANLRIRFGPDSFTHAGRNFRNSVVYPPQGERWSNRLTLAAHISLTPMITVPFYHGSGSNTRILQARYFRLF